MTLALHNLTVTLAGAAAPVFAPVTLTIPAGTVATIMGPSGSGKSTLLAAIGGHLGRGDRVQGHAALNGTEILALPAEARRIGLLFQDAMLFPHLSVGQNLAFGLAPEVTGRAARRAAVDAALDRAGMPGFHDRDPATLSGGERSRVALMRALLARPRALLLDEPFSRLDADLRDGLRRFVFDHLRDAGIPALLVTHDAADAAAAAGPVVRIGPPG